MEGFTNQSRCIELAYFRGKPGAHDNLFEREIAYWDCMHFVFTLNLVCEESTPQPFSIDPCKVFGLRHNDPNHLKDS